MSRHEDGPIAANGSLNGRTNGSSTASGRADNPAVTNGTHKVAGSVNGEANGQKNLAASQQDSYHGHDREEVTRILIQALSDMGYRNAAESVSRDSGYALENHTVAAFRSAVLSGSWSEAEQLLLDASEASDGEEGNGLVLAPRQNKTMMRSWLRQQKFLELLEQRDTSRALRVLRTELTPICLDSGRLHFLSGLLMCRSVEELMDRADWDGAEGESRKILLSELSKCISPSVMLPENRLAVLLQQVKQSQIDTCVYHTSPSPPTLYSDHSCDRQYFPSQVAVEIADLPGEVWQVVFSPSGKMLAACGQDHQVMIWDTNTFAVRQVLPGHEGGVGNLSWSPDNSMLVTCGQDKYARVWSVPDGSLLEKSRRFDEPVSGCVWAADSKSYVLGTLDKNHSLSTHTVGKQSEAVEWMKNHRVQDVCGSPDGRYIVAVDDVQMLHIYNGITRGAEAKMELQARPMSVAISKDSKRLLVNKRDGEAQLFDLTSRESVQKYLGHTGGDCLIRSSFGGANESFVVSGSDDGNILIWHKNIGTAVERLAGHLPRCNAVSWNPRDTCMLASCGDDGRIKIWAGAHNVNNLRMFRSPPPPAAPWPPPAPAEGRL